jgi:hypothetical protein
MTRSVPIRSALVLAVLPGCACAQWTLDAPFDWSMRQISLPNPKVAPQIAVLRSKEEADRFAIAAWGEPRRELHVDFAHEQVLAIAWGAHDWLPDGQDGPEVRSICAKVDDDVLKVLVRTTIPVGDGGEVAGAGTQRWYPSDFRRVPKTGRVKVEVVGARRRDKLRDFAPVVEPGLEVRVAVDAAPQRELARAMPTLTRGSGDVGVELGAGDTDGEECVAICWGRLGSGAYGLRVLGVVVRDGITRLEIEAENRPIMMYSGPGEHVPALSLAVPESKRVEVHIVRSGLPLDEGERDFEPSSKGRLTVTVDRSRIAVK